jgi:hypothetical protein
MSFLKLTCVFLRDRHAASQWLCMYEVSLERVEKGCFSVYFVFFSVVSFFSCFSCYKDGRSIETNVQVIDLDIVRRMCYRNRGRVRGRAEMDDITLGSTRPAITLFGSHHRHRRFWRSGSGVVPVSLARGDGQLVAGEAVLEEVEDGKLVARHDIGVGLGLDLAPDLRQRQLQDLADGGV